MIRMDADIFIKQLDNTYCPQIIDLVLPIQQIEFNVPVNLQQQPDMLDIEKYYIHSGGGFWGGFVREQLAGTIGLISIGHGAGVIRKMFVKKEFRGKELAIAQHLIETLVQHCKDNGIRDLYLGTVDGMKAAHRFYERNGFFRIDKADLPVYFPAMKTDNMFYHLHLDN
jgi:GNAT superfamily N-acetyltransferase